MRKTIPGFVLVFFLFWGTSLFAQTHVSVPVEHPVYYLLQQAEIRGLCSPMPSVRPYTRGRIVEAINEILAAEPGRFGGLSDAERLILEDARAEFSRGGKPGLDPWKGMYRFDNPGKKGVRFSGDFGIALDSVNSAAYSTDEDKAYFGTDTWGTVFFRGDVGEKFSFGVDFAAGIMKAERSLLGTYDTYASELEVASEENGSFNAAVDTYSHPKAFFPFTYQKHWDGFIFGPGNISADGMMPWPEEVSIAPSMLAEMSGSTLGDMLFLRAGRFQREWGGMVPGSSLILNAAARPFLGMEMTFNPLPWFSFSSLTGVLEYYNSKDIYDSAWTSQSAFSIQQLEFNYGKHFHIDFGSAATWSKRFELGYMFPLLDNFFYQNFIGKFDNMAIHGNLKLTYPGLGKFWFSGYLEELELSSASRVFELDRHMFALQTGVQGIIPGVPFATLTLSYTKIEPYTYTHIREYLPWYNPGADNWPMEKAYVNNGVGLGHYLPPNSDEIKVRFDIRPWFRTSGHWQYQLIRHGADFGRQQVDGSSLLSELDPSGRSSKTSLSKDFLNDGAYQWMHIIKFGMEHKFASLPLTLFGEAGIVYSYFKEIDQARYDELHPDMTGNTDYQARKGGEGEYVNSTSYIMTLGFRIFR